MAVPGFPLVMVLGLLAKLPVIAIPIVLTLHVTTGLEHAYGQAGLVIAGWTIGFTVGSPVQGRLIHRFSLRSVLAVSTVAQGVFWGLAAQMSYPVFAVGACLSGLLLVPGSTVVRLAIGGLVPQEHRQTAFAVDSVITEVSYMVGPALAALTVAAFSSSGVLASLCCAMVLSGGALVVFNPRYRQESAAPAAEDGRGAAPRRWLSVRLVAILACSLSAGAIVTGYEVAIVSTLRSMDQLGWAGLVVFGCGLYSLLGGLVFGTLSRTPAVPLMTGLLGLAAMPIGLSGHWWVLAVAVAPAAALCAPAFASTANATSQEADDSNRATVMSVYGSVLSAGGAIGASLAGAAFDAGGSKTAFASVGGLGVAVAVTAWVMLRRRPEAASGERKEELLRVRDG
ncbi:MFS transporter [Actinomycetota bacterium Odt1-20B]